MNRKEFIYGHVLISLILGEYFEKEETDEEQAMRMTKVEGLFRNIDLPPVEVYWNTHVTSRIVFAPLIIDLSNIPYQYSLFSS